MASTNASELGPSFQLYFRRLSDIKRFCFEQLAPLTRDSRILRDKAVDCTVFLELFRLRNRHIAGELNNIAAGIATIMTAWEPTYVHTTESGITSNAEAATYGWELSICRLFTSVYCAIPPTFIRLVRAIRAAANTVQDGLILK